MKGDIFLGSASTTLKNQCFANNSNLKIPTRKIVTQGYDLEFCDHIFEGQYGSFTYTCGFTEEDQYTASLKYSKLSFAHIVADTLDMTISARLFSSFSHLTSQRL